MKRILIIMILFVNLQIVINEGKGVVSSFSNAYAQHMTREADDNCYLAGFGWYHSPFSECEEPIVDGYNCSYCNSLFSSSETRDAHEEVCPQRPHECEYCHEMISGSMASHEAICPAKNDPNNDGSNNSYVGEGEGGGGENGNGYTDEGGGGGGLTEYWTIVLDPETIEIATELWGRYYPSSSEVVCHPFLPGRPPKQFSSNDCFITTLTNARLLDQIDMLPNAYSDLRQEIMQSFHELIGREVVETGILLNELAQYASNFGLEKSSVFAVQENINSGKYMLGVINNWSNMNVTHAVLIIGYDRNKQSEYRCMDPWNDSSQNGRYIYYNASRFRDVYRFK